MMFYFLWLYIYPSTSEYEPANRGWGAVSDLSLIFYLSQKFIHDLWRFKSKLKLSRNQHLTPDHIYISRRSLETKTDHMSVNACRPVIPKW